MTDSSEKPEGFEEILKEIQISFENNNDAVVQERVFKNAFNYVRKNTPKRHWFCDKYMFPVVIHLMIVFSFPPSEISKWIRLRIEESCENCQLCTIQYHKGKITLKEQLTYDKKIPMKQVNEFMKVIDVWESESAEANLEPFLNQELTLSILPTKLMFGIMSCLLNPNILRINQKLNLDLKAVFTKVPQTSLPEPTLLVPGIVYFLFEGSLEEKQWAKLTCKTISEIPVEQRELATMPPFLEEFKIWYYQIQDAKSFSISNCIKFWDVFLLVEPSVDTSILIGEMNSPKDLELQSISQNLRLYPLSRVLLNHLMSNLKEPLPVLLKVVAVYLKRLSEEFWTIVQPFTFINVLDRVLNDPNFALYLDTFLPKPSSSNGSLYNLIDWMSIFSNTLSGSQQQTAAVRISNYLLQRNLQNTESRKIIHELGCQLLSKSINNEDGIIGLKQFSMDLLKKRDCRAAIDNNAQLIVKLATIDKSNTSLELIKRSFNFDVTSLANHSINLQEGSVPTSFDVFPLLWSEVLKVPSLHSSVSLIMELLTSFKSVSGIMHFEPKKANPNVDKLFLSALAQHNRNANIVLGVLGKMLEKIALIDPSKLKSQAFNNDIVSVGYWSCVFQPQTSQSAIDILYLVFDDDEGTGTGRLEAIQALFKTSVKTTLLAINENLSTLVNMKCFEPCPKSVRILMDVIEALTDPLNGLLISHTLDSESQDQLKIFWQRSWLFLVMIYQGALTWANQYKIEKLIEFTRDTLDLSRKLLDSFMLVLDSTKSRSKEDSATLFKIFMHAFHYVIVWLRLGDVSLLNSCVDLVFKGFDLAKDLDISVDKDFLINFAKYGAKAKKFNNKLTENQRLEILGKAREFDDALVEKVVWEVQEQRQKSKAAEVAANKEALVQQQKLQLQQQQQQLKPIINVGSDSGAVYKYQTHIKQPRQQTLGRFGVVSKDAPIAPPPPQSFEPSSSLDAIRKSLQQSRTPGYKPLLHL